MQEKIVIIGAGISGLVAAIECEKAGYSPLIIEAADRVGGRVRTDEKDGYLLDHGFQVLLTEYREVRRYLDLDALQLGKFAPGALIFRDQKPTIRVTDPLRKPATLPGMLTSPVGSLKDKFLIWKLNRQLAAANREQLFEGEPVSTLTFLKNYGFSEKIIDLFFRPFFGGIFLENELATSSAMFCFVFKMFGTGYAALPNAGMEAIPRQLRNQLAKTRFRFKQKVEKVEGNLLHLPGGEQIRFEKLLISTDPSPFLPNLAGQAQEYYHTLNLYFSSDRPLIGQPLIGLVPEADFLINNFCDLNAAAPGYSSHGRSLVSVSLKQNHSTLEEGTADQVMAELKQLTHQPEADLRFLKAYEIRHALPRIERLHYDLPFTHFTLTNDIYLAGDYLLNASLDAAMRSGRRAAEALLHSMG